jgi:hypothetical protein
MGGSSSDVVLVMVLIIFSLFFLVSIGVYCGECILVSTLYSCEGWHVNLFLLKFQLVA